MLLSTCMKFYEHILNGFKVIDGHDFVTETATYKFQRDATQKVSYKSNGSLHSACRLMLVNICMKCHEDNGFKADMICHRTANYKLQRDVTKDTYSRVMVIVFCMLSFGA